MAKLTLFMRAGCSLCEEMQRELLQRQGEFGFTLETFDVDSDSRWQQLYDHKVPVLLGGEREICHYFADWQAIAEYFASL